MSELSAQDMSEKQALIWLEERETEAKNRSNHGGL